MKLSFFIFFFVSSNLYSSNVSGTIKNSTNGKSIPNANIFIEELKVGGISNSYGAFEIDVPEGQYTIKITNIGFKIFLSTINVKNEDILLDVLMEPIILELDEVSVEALFSTRLGYQSADIILKSILISYKLIQFICHPLVFFFIWMTCIISWYCLMPYPRWETNYISTILFIRN